MAKPVCCTLQGIAYVLFVFNVLHVNIDRAEYMYV